ncbi:hypothetical protein HGG73_12705 [Rhodobacteraceae bacterium R_SAG3]|nr:hypothetical protein [Rhodobacteraceae bacterium R_SAG3]
MNSALLNVWRENGAYLRYGDAKALFLMGLSVAVLFSFLKQVLIVPGNEWSQIQQLFLFSFGFGNGFFAIVFCLSALVALGSLLPTLSPKMVRVSIYCKIGVFLSRDPMIGGGLGVITFRDIAKFKSSKDYFDALCKKEIFENGCSSADEDLAHQIWVISKIAFSKFVAVNISASLLALGVGSFVASTIF